MNKIYLIIFISFLVGCSSDPYEEYIGYWESSKKIIEISKNGETILLDENIFNKNKANVLTKSDGALSLASFLGQIQLGLSEDRNTLLLGNKSFEKIDKKRVEELNSTCETLKKKYKEDNKVITDNFDRRQVEIEKIKDHMEKLTQGAENKSNNWSEWRKLKSDFQTKTKDIPGCTL
jgi:hypothetical protein